ncbi:hypothetical protein PPTG_00106 [Phytophthora nicotianae INRA-310]|uniref:Uncharacterized protein n=2 Tax=Phytophthora nicotianae TaxID=4792 RepID=W2RG40_PHYN3|nr:hypothetical protein PPTG_00106 [Phytophthora nicotianae INRA-310]ETN23515.1 hypothetical protein PPTG_00106 [Phytophthora nicotianae INRA-310]ETO86327.1 hypothetical protein F444_00125 [Phytophthora nicotianae P1976]
MTAGTRMGIHRHRNYLCGGWRPQATSIGGRVTTSLQYAKKFVRCLRQQGYQSVHAIATKIRWMQQKREDVNAWLKESERFVLYQQGEVDDAVRASVSGLCPAYDRVSPVFRNTLIDEDESDNLHTATKAKARPSQESWKMRSEVTVKSFLSASLERRKFELMSTSCAPKSWVARRCWTRVFFPDEVDRVLPRPV